MYMLMMCIGLIGMLIYVLKCRKKVNLSVLQSVSFTLLLTVVGLTGAYILGFVQYFKFGSINMFGTIYIVPLVMPTFGKLFRLTSKQVHDLTAICLAIVNTFVKVGCYFAGCCEGIITYVGNSYFQWPAQIMGFVGGTIIILWLLRIKAYNKWQGALYPLFMLSYGVMRFILNSITYIPVKWFGLQPSHWFALVSAVVGLIWFLVYKKHIPQKDSESFKIEVEAL